VSKDLNTLLPCPFCGAEEVARMEESNTACCVHCPICGTQGPPSSDRPLAGRTWNIRALDYKHCDNCKHLTYEYFIARHMCRQLAALVPGSDFYCAYWEQWKPERHEWIKEPERDWQAEWEAKITLKEKEE
jgi:hypothetical protein